LASAAAYEFRLRFDIAYYRLGTCGISTKRSKAMSGRVELRLGDAFPSCIGLQFRFLYAAI